MKRIFIIILGYVSGISTLFANPTKVNGVCYEFDDETLTAMVVSGRSIKYYYSDNVGNVTIPENVTYSQKIYSVTSIEEQAFAACSSIKTISIPKTITSIGYRAMTELGSLKSITVADDNPNYCSVDGVLFDKGKCTLITFPRENIKFRQNGIYNIPSSVTKIEGYAFKSCYVINVSISDNVEYIGERAFTDCSYLSTLSMSNNIQTIGKFAFSGCKGITSIYIPDTNTLLGDSVFFGCTELTSVRLSSNTLRVGNGAFYGCNKLTSITIPNSVKSIGQQAFGNCKALQSASIGNQVDSIFDHAFYNCSALTTVYLPNSVKYLGRQVFVQTAITQPLYNDYIFAHLPKAYIGDYIVVDGIEIVAPDAFQFCNSVTSVTLPNSIASIGENAFNNCHSLSFVNIPTNVTIIPDGTFAYCESLSAIDFPQGITAINRDAFYGCSGLNLVTCRAFNPPILGENAFGNVNTSSCTLYVPSQSITIYNNTETWQDFNPILPIGGTTDVKNLETTNKPAHKFIRNGNVYILTGDKTYTITGAEVK